jgi:hypothetical protein
MPALYHVRFRARIVEELSCTSNILKPFLLFVVRRNGLRHRHTEDNVGDFLDRDGEGERIRRETDG